MPGIGEVIMCTTEFDLGSLSLLARDVCIHDSGKGHLRSMHTLPWGAGTPSSESEALFIPISRSHGPEMASSKHLLSIEAN